MASTRFSKRKAFPSFPMAIEGTARAKINLALHVTGRLGNGMHLLDSVVVFADFGDRITVEPSASLSVLVRGPMADKTPAGEGNLAYRAARLLDPNVRARITLEKRLPVASGVGGGSADAAEVLKLLSNLYGISLPEPRRIAELGADVPVCLFGLPARVRGIGDDIKRMPAIPRLSLVLANPGVPLGTGAVFSALSSAGNPPMDDTVPVNAWKGRIRCLAGAAAERS